MPRKKSVNYTTNVDHPELADAFAVKLFKKDIDRILRISEKTHLRRATIIRTAIQYAFDNGFRL